jgi:hypothetical protein
MRLSSFEQINKVTAKIKTMTAAVKKIKSRGSYSRNCVSSGFLFCLAESSKNREFLHEWKTGEIA